MKKCQQCPPPSPLHPSCGRLEAQLTWRNPVSLKQFLTFAARPKKYPQRQLVGVAQRVPQLPGIRLFSFTEVFCDPCPHTPWEAASRVSGFKQSSCSLNFAASCLRGQLQFSFILQNVT